MQIVNLTEECDKLRTEVDSKELMLQSRTDEMADVCTIYEFRNVIK